MYYCELRDCLLGLLAITWLLSVQIWCLIIEWVVYTQQKLISYTLGAGKSKLKVLAYGCLVRASLLVMLCPLEVEEAREISGCI